MSGISTHVLDLALGRPAMGVAVRLERRSGESWIELGRGATDGDGRAAALLPSGLPLVAGTYRLTFDLDGYFNARKIPHFFPEAALVFTVTDPAARHHVPLLLSPHGYSTYRGS